ncbi:uncharacterized protein [Littorina saxatilis]|uniref:uncharacterized protein n=1 Tax=Littorina saxatilis TaxID=31220 RepID=UPI0038B471E7
MEDTQIFGSQRCRKGSVALSGSRVPVSTLQTDRSRSSVGGGERERKRDRQTQRKREIETESYR